MLVLLLLCFLELFYLNFCYIVLSAATGLEDWSSCTMVEREALVTSFLSSLTYLPGHLMRGDENVLTARAEFVDPAARDVVMLQEVTLLGPALRCSRRLAVPFLINKCILYIQCSVL